MRRGLGIAAVLGLVGTLAIGASGSPALGTSGPGEPTCVLDEAELRIDPGFFDLRIVRDGDEIVPRISSGPLPCEGETPTVNTVDRVFLASTEITIDLKGGPFAPGFTDEGDGSSEIEFEVTARSGGAFFLKLTDSADRITAGGLSKGRRAFNLNAGEQAPDADLEFPKPRRRFGPHELLLLARRGADRLSTRAGAEFTRDFPQRLFMVLGRGRDAFQGGRDIDFVAGGRGEDRLITGGGDDLAVVRDKQRDVALCGRGDDRVASDPRDRTRSCREVGLN